MNDHYPYRLTVERRDLFLLWCGGEDDHPDQFIVDAQGKLIAFDDIPALRRWCETHRLALVPDTEGSLDLRLVRQWVKQPHLRIASAGLLLDAWNFFDDLSHSLTARSSLPAQGPVHDSAYEKLFAGDPLARHGGDGIWTDQETSAVKELLGAGMNLWDRQSPRVPH